MKENISAYPIHIKKPENDIEEKDHTDGLNMVPLLFPQNKQTIEETSGYQDVSISPLIINFTQGCHTNVNEQSEESESDGELTHPVITQIQVDAS